MKEKKVVVVGIDGGELDVFKRMIKKGIMPNLDKMMNRGFVTSIDTYVQGHGQGWASFITGKIPEKHGVFYWNLYTRLVNSQSIKDKFLWEILGEKGIRSCIINMSYTYPTRPFNGYMITGLGSGLSMSKNMKITYPEDLMDEINRDVGNYIVACEYKEGSVNDHINLVNELIRMTEYRTKACLYIMDKYSPEFVLAVFRGADLIQHCYWNLLEPDFITSEINKPLQNLIESYYRELDHSIGRIFATYGNSTNIIVSDHGFGPVKAIVYLNTYLSECGLLFKKQEINKKKRTISFSPIRSVLKSIYKKTLINYDFFRKLNRFRSQLEGINLPIDKKKTIAYSDTFFGININKESLSTQNSKTTKQEIMQRLQDLKDPRTNEKIIENIYLKEDSYAKDLNDAPDIMFEVNESYLVTYEMSLTNNDIFKYMDKEETAFFTGSHRRSGSLVIDEKDAITLLKQEDINITDVFSTILNLFEIKIPLDIDGQIIFKKAKNLLK